MFTPFFDEKKKVFFLSFHVNEFCITHWWTRTFVGTAISINSWLERMHQLHERHYCHQWQHKYINIILKVLLPMSSSGMAWNCGAAAVDEAVP